MNRGVIGKGKVLVIGSSATRIEVNEGRSGGIILVALTCILCLFYTVLMVEAHNKK